MKKLQRIETSDYTLWVSDEEIKEGDWVLNISNNKVFKQDNDKPDAYTLNFWKKIIAYQPKGNAPELDLPLLPEMDVDDDVEKLAYDYYTTNEHYKAADAFHWANGYKAATKIYSEEALRGFCKFYTENLTNSIWDSMELYIQSIKQPTPKWFVAEREKVYHANRKGVTEFQDSKGFYSWKLKTTTKNGKTYLVGKYL